MHIYIYIYTIICVYITKYIYIYNMASPVRPIPGWACGREELQVV